MASIVGMDEVGRGSWAGPVVVGAVILAGRIEGLADSKLLTKRVRTRLADEIHAQTAWGIGEASSAEIDELGLTAALSLAYGRALAKITSRYDSVIIDGSFNFLPSNPLTQTLVKADQFVPAVSAASIIAKVYRDTLMAKHALQLPGYGFDRHVGYGTAAHSAALRLNGPCILHRRSFAPVKAALGAVT